MSKLTILGDQIYWNGDLVGLITREVVRHDSVDEFIYELEHHLEPDNDEFVWQVLNSVGEKLPAPKAGFIPFKDVQKAILETLEEYME